MSSEDETLPVLPEHDIDPRIGERIRRRAQAALASERRLVDRPHLARASRFYSRAIEPTLVVGACIVYLDWAIRATLALMH